MNSLIMEYYKPITFYAYIFLFAINIIVICNYFWKKESDSSIKNFSVFDLFYIAFCLLFIFIQRYFTFFTLKTNTDESFHLAVALKYINGDHFWVDIDPSSVGPLNTLLFYFISLFTGEMGYITAKIATFSVICLSFVLIYLASIKIVPRFVACILSACFSVHMCIPVGHTSVSYNSEMILLPLLALWMLCFINVRQGKKYWHYLEFLVIGAIPFGKLQFGPIAAFLFVVGVVNIFIERDYSIKKTGVFIKHLIPYFFTSLIPLLTVVLNAYINDGLIWFFRFYFLNMISYTQVSHLELTESIYQIMFDNLVFFWTDRFFLYTLTPLNIFLTIACLMNRKFKTAFFCLLFVSVSAYVVVRPLFYFLHYTNIMIFPLFVCPVFLLSSLKSRKYNFLVILTSIFFLAFYFNDFDDDYAEKIKWTQRTGYSSKWYEIAEDLKQISNESDRLVVWGWLDELYLLSGMPGGTAEIAIGGFVPSKVIDRIYPSYTKQKFIDDIINNRPRFIIDTPSPYTDIYDSYEYSIRNYPEVWMVVEKNYHLRKKYVLQGKNCEIFDETCRDVQISLYEINN